MPFFSFSRTNIQFDTKTFTWRLYTTAEPLPIIRQMKLIDQKEFNKVALYESFETFVIYIATLEAPKIKIYLFQTAKMASL